jgi:hypothetical protein
MPTKKPVKKRPKKRATLPLKKIKRKARKWRNPIQALLEMPSEPESMTEIETTVDATQTERKLSAKIIVGKRIGKIEAPTDLFTVIGIATGLRTGQSTYGEWIGLKGEFEVVRCEDGKVLRAPIMILPDAAMTELMGSAWPVVFAFLVRVVPSTNEQGFEYEVEKLVPPGPYDALEDLRVQLRSNRVPHG